MHAPSMVQHVTHRSMLYRATNVIEMSMAATAVMTQRLSILTGGPDGWLNIHCNKRVGVSPAVSVPNGSNTSVNSHVNTTVPRITG